jgi:hypothetical protein
VRRFAGDDVRQIVVIGGIAAPRRRRRGARPRHASAEAGRVEVTRATVVEAVPLGDPEAADDWLARATGTDADRVTGEALALLNRAVAGQRVAAADPWLPDADPARALACRIGYGTGEQVAEGDWEAARELPPPDRRTLRSLSPQERLAALLSGRDAVLACEELYEFTFPFQARSKDPSFRTPILRRPIVWEDPERGDLTARRARALARPGKAAERALYGPGSWRRRIDPASAVDFALLNELFKNEDGFHRSTYMALGADGRLHLGPIWDFDISMGNSDYGPSRRLRGWMLARRDWAERLYRDRTFRSAMARRWRELRAGGLRGRVLGAVEGSRRELRGAAGRNFRRWPVLGRRIWPNPVARGSFRAEVAFLRSWLARRITWLDGRLGRQAASSARTAAPCTGAPFGSLDAISPGRGGSPGIDSMKGSVSTR